MKRELICINCPRGCHLTAIISPENNITVTGNSCPRGEAYAIQEMTDPRRTVTAVIKTTFPDCPFLPVRTNAPFPKARAASLLNRIYKMQIDRPLRRGACIIQNIDGTGIDLIACATIPEKTI